MSGHFFERLAERALGTAPVLQPRRASRFESSPLALHEVATETLAPAPQRTAPALQGTPQAEQAVSRENAAAPVATVVQRQFVTTQEPSREHPAAMDAPPPVVTPSEYVMQHLPAPATGTTRDSAMTVLERFETERERSMPVLLTDDLSWRSRVEELEGKVNDSSRETTPSVHSEGIVPATPAPREVPVVRPVITPEVRAAKEAALPVAPSSPPVVERSVQINIGRIEVRAALNGPVPRTRTPAAPRLSLEDYLRKREGA